MGAVTETPPGPPVISPRALSDALAALGAYAEAPTAAQLAAAELAEGRAALTARLANALHGAALAHVMTAEYVASEAKARSPHRRETWTGGVADTEGIAILLHYTAMRLAADLRVIYEALDVDLGVLAAAAAATDALTLLLEVTTVTSAADPRAKNVVINLDRAADLLAAAAGRVDTLLDAGRDPDTFIAPLL